MTELGYDIDNIDFRANNLVSINSSDVTNIFSINCYGEGYVVEVSGSGATGTVICGQILFNS